MSRLNKAWVKRVTNWRAYIVTPLLMIPFLLCSGLIFLVRGFASLILKLCDAYEYVWELVLGFLKVDKIIDWVERGEQ